MFQKGEETDVLSREQCATARAFEIMVEESLIWLVDCNSPALFQVFRFSRIMMLLPCFPN